MAIKQELVGLLLEFGVPVTRDSILELQFGGNVPQDIPPEVMEELADMGFGTIAPDAPPHEN
jgi:hypothetical protein